MRSLIAGEMAGRTHHGRCQRVGVRWIQLNIVENQ